jgi:hypothetical protein
MEKCVEKGKNGKFSQKEGVVVKRFFLYYNINFLKSQSGAHIWVIAGSS